MTKTQWKKVWKLFNASFQDKRKKVFWDPSWRIQKRMIEQSVEAVMRAKK